MKIKIGADLRGKLGPARDQGQRPTCLAFAISDVHAVFRNAGLFEPLSVEYLFFKGIKRTSHKNPHRGLTLPAAVLALKNDGQPAEAVWPYITALPDDLSSWKPPPTSELHRAHLQNGNSKLAVLRSFIDAGKPALAILKLSESFYRPNSDGVVDVANPDPDTSLHAVVAVGYGTVGTEDLILVRNSWGPTWGIKGYGWLQGHYVANRLKGLATIA